MSKRSRSSLVLVLAVGMLASPSARGQSLAPAMGGCQFALPALTLDATASLMQTVKGASFPELASADLRMRAFHSPSDYLQTRFSLPRFFLLRPMRYFVEINPRLFQQQAPDDGVCAILAHELSHVVSLSHGNRVRRFGLIRLLSRGYTAKFERATDLEAIHRGYAEGLKSYRLWVYLHAPSNKLAAKRRNYFSPMEIAAIQTKLTEEPELLGYWRKHVPMSLGQIEGTR